MEKLKIVREKAKKIGLTGDIVPSKKKYKKYDYIKNGHLVSSFGDIRYNDFLDHKDKLRRDNYRKRAGHIKLKDGTYAVDKYESPAFLSYYLLW